MPHADVQTIYLPGYDQDPLGQATPGSAGTDLFCILSRPVVDNDDAKFFTWKSKRHETTHDTVADFLQATRPDEAQRILAMEKFPSQFLTLFIQPGETLRVPLGIKTRFSPNFVAFLYARASSAKKEYRLGNCVGVIDSDYPDEWFAAIRNDGQKPLVISHGQRLVQVVFSERCSVDFPAVDALPKSERTGGFGSTGSGGVSVLEGLDGLLTPQQAADIAAELAVEEAIVADSERELLELEADLVDMSDPIPPEEPPVNVKPVSVPVETEPAPPPVDNDVWNVDLICNGVRVGPVAKFRLSQLGPLQKKSGTPAVAGVLERETKIHIPKALPKLVDELIQKYGG